MEFDSEENVCDLLDSGCEALSSIEAFVQLKSTALRPNLMSLTPQGDMVAALLPLRVFCTFGSLPIDERETRTGIEAYSDSWENLLSTLSKVVPPSVQIHVNRVAASFKDCLDFSYAILFDRAVANVDRYNKLVESVQKLKDAWSVSLLDPKTTSGADAKATVTASLTKETVSDIGTVVGEAVAKAIHKKPKRKFTRSAVSLTKTDSVKEQMDDDTKEAVAEIRRRHRECQKNSRARIRFAGGYKGYGKIVDQLMKEPKWKPKVKHLKADTLVRYAKGYR